jgi:phenylacetate-CoA ligase
VIPTSVGNTDRQIMVMKDFGVTVISCTPSYFVHLMERAEELGVDIKDRKDGADWSFRSAAQ